MRYWWVNHKQTARQEIAGGYIWSPKTERGGTRSQYYDFMKETRPGDGILSYANGFVSYFGIISGLPLSSPKPAEFGPSGAAWSNDGWAVPVDWHPVGTPIRPREHMIELLPDLPQKYSPIQDNGNGNQKAYLTQIDKSLFAKLFLISNTSMSLLEAGIASDGTADLSEKIGNEVEEKIRLGEDSRNTETISVIKARRGQGAFRQNVMSLEERCRVTGIDDSRLLIASHIKPWRVCASNAERLAGANGLMLAPQIDRLFDLALISFEDDGSMLVSSSVSLENRKRLGILDAIENGVGVFSDYQALYLAYHRKCFLA